MADCNLPPKQETSAHEELHTLISEAVDAADRGELLQVEAVLAKHDARVARRTLREE